jgi:hypothetical protein
MKYKMLFFAAEFFLAAFSVHAQEKAFFPRNNTPLPVVGGTHSRDRLEMQMHPDAANAMHGPGKLSGLRLQQPLASEDTWDSLFNTRGYGYIIDNANIFAMASDGDDLYLAGSFEGFDTARCFHIVHYNKVSNVWSDLGFGFGRTVYALAIHDRKLYAGGDFTTPGFSSSTSMAHIAVWDGSTWKELGGGTNGTVRCIAFTDSSVIVGGYFSQAGTTTVSNIARWDGHGWSDMGGGLNDIVDCLAASGDSVFAGGNFYQSSTKLRSVALYTNGSWENLDEGFSGEVYALTIYQGKLWAGGDIFWPYATDIHSLASWDGTSWSSPFTDTITKGNQGIVRSLGVRNGALYIGGSFVTMGGINAHSIVKYSGGVFTPLSTGVFGSVTAMNVFGGDLYVGGNFTEAGGVALEHLAKLNVSDSWQAANVSFGPYGGYPATAVYAVTSNDKYVFIGGEFVNLAGVTVNHIAMWDKTTRKWSPLGKGVDGNVNALTVYGSKLYVGGEFTYADTNIVHYIAYFDLDTKSWHSMGDGSARFIDDIAADASGAYASIYYPLEGNVFNNYLGRWDGSKWVQMDGAITGYINAIAKTGDSIMIGGVISSIDGNPYNNIAIHTSNGWDSFGDGLSDRVEQIVSTPDGIYAGGNFAMSGTTTLFGIGKWDGTEWLDLDGGMNARVRALAWDGKALYVGGYFTKAGSLSVSALAKWDGSSWSDVGGGADYNVYALATDGKSLFVGGGFSNVENNFFSYRFAILHFGSQGVGKDDVPAKDDLSQNFPNPFATETTIGYSVLKDTHVRIELYDVLGNNVRELVNENEIQGDHSIMLNAAGLTSGMYLCRFETDETSEARWIQVVK